MTNTFHTGSFACVSVINKEYYMKPLEGIKVVELASFIAVPSAAYIMCNWGAEVIKIEPLEGDYYRNFGYTVGLPTQPDLNPAFTAINSGKKLVSVNLKSKEGIDAIKKLLKDADVFMTNIRYRSVIKLGLGYEDIHKEFPKLVYFHFDGYGKKGPDVDRPGFDQAAFWAYAGISNDWSTKGETPVRPGHGFGDAVTSFNVSNGILAALLRQRTTGEGCYVSSSLFASGIWGNYISLISQGAPSPTMEFPRKLETENYPFAHIYECSDGRWMLWYSTSVRLNDCLRAIGREDLVGNPKFLNRNTVSENKVELYHIIKEASLKHDSDYWDKLLTEYDIVHCRLFTMQETLQSEQAWANGYFQKVMFGDQEYVIPTAPMEFSDYEHPQIKPCGYIGSDTREVFKNIGYTDEEIDKMVSDGVVLDN